MVVEAEAGRYNGTSATFQQLATKWLELVEADLSPTTLRGYQNKLKVRIFPAIGDRPVKKITTDDLDQFYRGLVKQGGLKPATVRQINAIVRRALRQAVIWEWITSNPADNVTPPRVTKAKLSPPNADQVGEILHYATTHNPELGHFLHIATSTGARRGEMCALRWSNLDTSKRTLTIEHSIAEVPGGPIHTTRRFPLTPTSTWCTSTKVSSLAERQRQRDPLFSQVNRSRSASTRTAARSTHPSCPRLQ
jgi:integrase